MRTFIFRIFWNWKKSFEKAAIVNLKKTNNIPNNVEIFYPITFVGNIIIGENTYLMKNCELITGEDSTITIGDNCAIARNVTIRSLTHIKGKKLYRLKNLREKSITIGNDCWIGANVFIKEGIEIGNNCIIGANSVVTKSFPENSIIAGIPARLIGDNL